MNFASILNYDSATGQFTRSSNGKKTGTINSKGYIQIYAYGKRWSAHRLAWLMVYGSWPSRHIDHINRIKTDNRIENLRDVSPHENNENRAPFEYPPRPLGNTGVKGATLTERGDFIVKKWDKRTSRQIYLGRAKSLDEARNMMAAQS